MGSSGISSSKKLFFKREFGFVGPEFSKGLVGEAMSARLRLLMLLWSIGFFCDDLISGSSAISSYLGKVVVARFKLDIPTRLARLITVGGFSGWASGVEINFDS